LMKSLRLILSTVIVLLALPVSAVFAQYNSSNYSANELQFGSGGELDSSSANYKAQTSIGSLGVDSGSSANYKGYSGFLTPNEPFLEFAIDSSSVALGTLDPAAAKTGTAAFHVRAYVDSGYTVQTLSQPPTQTSGTVHTLTGMSSVGPSVVGTEQFGINLKANTSPATFGADPVPFPDSTFAAGVAFAGYSTTNQYRYVIGDSIAGSSGSGWGLTNYTISYIANINPLTPAGAYTMVHDLVVVATY
jgi:hypothetical protein